MSIKTCLCFINYIALLIIWTIKHRLYKSWLLSPLIMLIMTTNDRIELKLYNKLRVVEGTCRLTACFSVQMYCQQLWDVGRVDTKSHIHSLRNINPECLRSLARSPLQGAANECRPRKTCNMIEWIMRMSTKGQCLMEAGSQVTFCLPAKYHILHIRFSHDYRSMYIMTILLLRTQWS